MESKAIEIMVEPKILIQYVGGVEFYGFSTFLRRTLKSTFQTMQNLVRVFRQGYCNL
jgi:hypothetical protein